MFDFLPSLDSLDIYTAIVYSILYSVLFLFYLLVFHTESKNYGYYRDFVWYQPLKHWWAKSAVREYQKKYIKLISGETEEEIEKPHKLTSFYQTDCQIFYGVDKECLFYLKLISREHRVLETCLFLKLSDGTVYQLPEHPNVLLSSIPERQWYAKGLCIEIIQPFKVLRIMYNGLLRNNSNHIEHVNFKFLWTASHSPFFHPQHSDIDFLSNSVAKEPWKDGQWIQFLGTEYGYKQFGGLLGRIKYPNTSKPIEYIHLSSVRTRLWGPSESKSVYRNITLFCTDNKCSFIIGVKSFKSGCREFNYGSVIFPDLEIHTIESCDLSLVNFEGLITPRAFKVNFTVRKQRFHCTVFLRQSLTQFVNDELAGWQSELVHANCMVNDSEATGVIVFWNNRKGKSVELPSYIVRPGEVNTYRLALVAKLTEKECKSVSLAGDEAVSLSLLSSVRDKRIAFAVPMGFCVLVPALEHHINNNERLKNAFLRNDYENVSELLVTERLSDDLLTLIYDELRDIRTKHEMLIATPSYVDPSEYLSANDKVVYNNLRTDEDVILAIKKCWALLFSYESMTHRKRSLSVVIRGTVPAGVSGYLFTNHPCNSDPSRMLVTNHRLGLAVDSNEIMVGRTWDGALNVVPNQGFGLDSSQTMRIAEIGLLIEKSFGRPCSVKWTYSDDLFHVLKVMELSVNYSSSFIVPPVRDGPFSYPGRLVGRSASGDVAVGRACVVTDPRHARNIKQGDILITTNVDASYAALFPRLHGIVTELAGVFSYGCSVAKGLDVPCLVGCEDATAALRTGDTVLLNGRFGFVEKIH